MSSDIQEGLDANDVCYCSQNYTVAIFYRKMQRFQMYEYQVKWKANLADPAKSKQPYDVQISLIKLRDVVFNETH